MKESTSLEQQEAHLRQNFQFIYIEYQYLTSMLSTRYF